MESVLIPWKFHGGNSIQIFPDFSCFVQSFDHRFSFFFFFFEYNQEFIFFIYIYKPMKYETILKQRIRFRGRKNFWKLKIRCTILIVSCRVLNEEDLICIIRIITL